MSQIRTLRLGSRASLLAIVQSRLVAAELQAVNPGINIEIVTLNTRGDSDISTPLTEINDPDFFSAELDAALLAGEIDFCVHSFKDLDTERPASITCAAIPKRENPADVVLFRSDIEAHIAAGRRVTIGSCSTRRQRNAGDFLRKALPRHAEVQLDFVPLRGTVPERVERILPEAAERLDGVIVALAGLERLWNDPAGRRRIAPAIEHAQQMVLPLSACPAAPGQGALKIECRADDSATRAVLATIHDPFTAHLLDVEANLVSQLVAGHDAEPSAIGATAWEHPALGYVARARWRSDAPDAGAVTLCSTPDQPAKPAAAKPWISPAGTHRTFIPAATEIPAADFLFIAHWRALEHLQPAHHSRVWTSGVVSWQQLAARGIWVEGCTDHLGIATLPDWISNAVLRLPEFSAWTALTHVGAVNSWRNSGIGATLATYRLTRVNAGNATPELDTISVSTHFFWRTPQQYQRYGHLAPADAHHACGPGKTLQALRDAGVKNLAPFPSYKEWQQWLA